MAVPTSIDDLSATAASNGPDGATDLPSAYDDYIRAISAFIRQLRDGKEFPPLLSSVAGTDTITASAPAAITAYAAGQRFSFVASATNTGAVTLNINSLGAKDVTKRGTTALAAGDITSGQVVVVEYDGTRFQLLAAPPSQTSATTRAQYPLASQVQDGALTALSSVSGADTITATAPLSMSAYVTGQMFSFVSAGANTGAVTLNLNSIGAKAVTKWGTVALAAGDIQSGETCFVIYDGTRFQMLGVRRRIYSATAQATTSGTEKDFTGIPSWAKRITVSVSGLSTSGTSQPILQGIVSGSPATSIYSGTTLYSGGSGNFPSTGVGLVGANNIASAVFRGVVEFIRQDDTSHTWGVVGSLGRTDVANLHIIAGSMVLSGQIEGIRLTTVGGSDTLDLGSANVSWS